MRGAKTWLAIPPIGLVCAAAAWLAGVSPVAAVACGALAAAIAGAVRAYDGPSLAVAIAGAAAGAFGGLALVDRALVDPATTRAACAGIAALFALAELARPAAVTASPWPALGAAWLAGALDPAYLGVAVVAGARLAFGPAPRPKAALAAPIAGVLACALAVLAALAQHGALASFWSAWLGLAPAPAAPPVQVLALAGDALGPLAIVAAAAGLASGATRGRIAGGALAAASAGALAIDVHAGAVTPATSIVAALAVGLGIARLTALVRHPSGQAWVGATAAFVVLVAPVWTLAVR